MEYEIGDRVIGKYSKIFRGTIISLYENRCCIEMDNEYTTQMKKVIKWVYQHSVEPDKQYIRDKKLEKLLDGI